MAVLSEYTPFPAFAKKDHEYVTYVNAALSTQ